MPKVTSRATRPHSRQKAADALMDELERWRVELGHFPRCEGGNPYSPGQSWTSFVVAHRESRLIEHMTEWLADYRGLSNDSAATSMIEIVKAGQRTWQHILLEPNKPWTPHVSNAQRAKLLECLRDCYARAASHLAMRVKLEQPRM